MTFTYNSCTCAVNLPSHNRLLSEYNHNLLLSRAIEFKEVLAQLQLEMENFGIDKTSIKTAKHNLRRTLERSLEGLCFVNDDSGKLIMFPNNLDLKALVLENQALKNEISELKSCSENVKMIANVAGIIRDEISKMNDTMPWPPSETDFTPDKVKIGENLDAFLNTLLTERL